jgi:hypothetical protein
MTTKIVDISDEIYRELGEPEDISISSIAFWLRTNLGKLNILLDKNYTINQIDLEVEAISQESFSILEKTIFKKLYNIHYYDRQILNLVGKTKNVTIINTSGTANQGNLQISENGMTYNRENSTKTSAESIKANAQFLSQMGKNFIDLKKQENVELKELLKKYELNENTPLQVAGDDTVGDPGRSYTYSNYVRNIENL